MGFCTNCGTQMMKDARFCNNCGTKANPAPGQTQLHAHTQPGTQKPPSPNRKYAITAIIIVIMIAGGTFFLRNWGNGGGSANRRSDVEIWEAVSWRGYAYEQGGRFVNDHIYMPGEVILEIHADGTAVFIEGGWRQYGYLSNGILQQNYTPWVMEMRGDELLLTDEWEHGSVWSGFVRNRVYWTFRRR